MITLYIMSQRTINRRDWLKAGALFSAGLSFGIRSAFPKELIETTIHPFSGEWVGDFPLDVPLKAKLNANENPYGPSEKALESFNKELNEQANRYGSPLSREFTTFMAEQNRLNENQVILSAGSLELLQLSALTFGAKNGNIISAFPTFEPLLRNAESIGCDWKQVDVDGNLIHDLKGMEAAIDGKTGLMYVCNPNNPTGTLLDPDELRVFCKRVSKRIPVFVDEAYNEFLAPEIQEKHSMLDLVREGHQVIVCKTFSKLHGFAGLRVGYALGNAQLISKMTRYRNYQTTLTRPSMKAAMTSYVDEDFKAYCRDKTSVAREFTYNELVKRGFQPTKSHTSFMVFPIEMSGGTFIRKMADQGVGIRSWYFKSQDWCRVSIGTMEEMKLFLQALDKVHV